MTNPTHVCRPTTLKQALTLLSEGVHDEEPWVPLALDEGFETWCSERGLHLDRVLDTRQIVGLRDLTESEGEIHIGANTTFQELQTSTLVQTFAPPLAAAARWGGPHPRPCLPMLGGSVIDGLPTAHNVLALAVCHAEFTLVSNAGLRAIEFDAMYDDEGNNQLHPDELLLSISIPKPNPQTFARFARFGVRASSPEIWTCATLGLRLECEANTVISALVAVGELRDTLWHLKNVENALVGAEVSEKIAVTAGALTLELLQDDHPKLAKRLAASVRRQIASWVKKQLT